MAKNPNDYALVIGINDYPKFRGLNGAVNDAKAFLKWLTKDTGGGLDETHCLDVISTPDPLSPDNNDIDDKVVELWNNVLESGQKGRRLYFYFSGHGTGVDSNDVGLCYSLWATGKNRAMLSSEKYVNYFKNKGLFSEIIVILDCCRVYSDAPGFPPSLTDAGPDRQETPGVLSLTLYGSEFLSQSLEAAGQNTPEIRGYFTEALLDGLNGKAAKPNGEVTLENLRNYLDREVPRRSNHRQKPRFLLDGMADSAVIYSGARQLVSYQYGKSPANLSIAYKPGIDAEVNVYTVFNEIRHKGTSATNLFLATGKYYLVVNYKDFVDTDEIDLQADYTYLVDGQTTKPAETTETTRSPSLGSPEPQKVQPPDSATLIGGNNTTHEPFGNPAEKASRTPTHSITDETGARLLIFIRHAHPKPDPDMAKGLALTDSAGQICSIFADNELFIEFPEGNPNPDPERYKRDGYIALSVEANPGLYYLNYFGDKPRQLLIRLYANRQTVVIMLYDNQPLFKTARIFLPSIQNGYRVYDPAKKQENADLDTAIALFQNNQSFISPGVVEKMLEAKFHNPMMGIIGAYLLLRGRMNKEGWYRGFLKLVEQVCNWSEKQYFDHVISNLGNLLGPNDPDLKTIRLLASDFLEEYRAESFVFDEPPMIDWGLRQVISRSIENPTLIAPNSLITA